MKRTNVKKKRLRSAVVLYKTKETAVRAVLSIDGRGCSKIRTGIRFLDHMLDLLARHGLFDLEVNAKGDLEVDRHHTNEDVGIALGMAFKKALGDKQGIRRFGDVRAPLDESLTEVRVSLDLSGRGSLHWHTRPATRWITDPLLREKKLVKDYSLSDAKHFLESFARHAGVNLHVDFISGEYSHHVIESMFKALAKSLDGATQKDERVKGVPSTKGAI